MTFPTLPGTPTTGSDNSGTDHVVTLPASIAAGERIQVFFSNDGSATSAVTTPATGWSELGTAVGNNNANRLTIFERIADGTEGDTTITVTTSADEGTSWIARRVAGAHASTPSEVAFSAAEGTNREPPALNPSAWDAEDTLWTAVLGWDSNDTGPSSYPTDYSSQQVTTGDGSHGNANSASVAIASRTNAVSSEDPGAFGTVGGEQAATATLAVRPAAAGQTVAIGQATETDTSTALGRLKAKLLGQITETDTAQVITRLKTKLFGQALETSTAQPTTHSKTVQIGQASETNEAQPVTPHERHAVTQAIETDTAQVITPQLTGGQTVNVGQASETNTAQLVAWAPKHRLIGQSLEADTSTALTRLKRFTIGQSLETDTGQTVTPRRSIFVNQALETDTATALGRSKSKLLGQSVETDTPFTITWKPTRLIGQALQTETAFIISPEAALNVPIGQAVETDTSTALLKKKQKAIGQSSEVDTSQTVTPRRTYLIGLSQEADTTLALTKVKSRVLGQATETDTVTILLVKKSKGVGLATETDTAITIVFGVPEQVSGGTAIVPARVYNVVVRDEDQAVTPSRIYEGVR